VAAVVLASVASSGSGDDGGNSNDDNDGSDRGGEDDAADDKLIAAIEAAAVTTTTTPASWRWRKQKRRFASSWFASAAFASVPIPHHCQPAWGDDCLDDSSRRVFRACRRGLAPGGAAGRGRERQGLLLTARPAQRAAPLRGRGAGGF